MPNEKRPAEPSSRVPGYHKLTVKERREALRAFGLADADLDALEQGLPLERADGMIENVVGTFRLPLGVATNFVVNGREVLVPMAIEESSVVAAASAAAKLARATGGFTAKAVDPQLATAQVQLVDVPDVRKARAAVNAHLGGIIHAANATQPRLVARGGGARFVEPRTVTTESGEVSLVVHLHVDTRDAMGANLVNTMAEAVAPLLEDLTGGRALLRILSNLTTRRVTRASCVITKDDLGGADVVRDMIRAVEFADADPYRATTHNKGVMNGIDPVVIATGNDWRAVEAGAHAWAARTGRYRSLTTFRETPGGDLACEIALPLALGIVGGATRVHPTAQAALKLLGVTRATQLAEIVASVGLAQNLAAVRALATEGIQKGHMRLHAKNLAVTAGVPAEKVDAVVARMLADGGTPSVGRAQAAWEALQDDE